MKEPRFFFNACNPIVAIILVMAGKERWVNEEGNSHELYNAGHLYEAAVAHYHATGSTWTWRSFILMSGGRMAGFQKGD